MKIEGIHYATENKVTVSLEANKITEVMVEPKQQSDESLPYLAPGLVDLQINGFQGYDFNTLPITEKMVVEATQLLWAEGVTSYYPTVITNSDEAIEEAVKVIAQACEKNPLVDACVAGIHVEGPFITPEDGPRGAHGKQYVKAPDWGLFERWQQAAQGKIKILTISPEWEGSSAFIEKCVESGVVVSIGHTAANAEQIKAAVAAGATMSTHLGNGAHPMLPRHPNYIWEQLAQDSLWTCLIPDGFHLPDSFLKVAMRAKNPKVMLVSDAVYLSGLEPGEYKTHIGGEVVLTPEGKLHLQGNPKILAGSAQMLKTGIAQLVRNEICTLKETWEMASLRPATFMNLPAKEGLIKGNLADVVLFDYQTGQINIRQTYKAGELVYSK